jgi:hypothetical protein
VPNHPLHRRRRLPPLRGHQQVRAQLIEQAFYCAPVKLANECHVAMSQNHAQCLFFSVSKLDENFRQF